MTNATDEIPSDLYDKDLAAGATAGQDTRTTQDVNREEPNVRTRFRGRPTTAKAKDTGRVELQAFADALDALMKRAGLKPSDVARIVWGTTVDSRGYTVPRNRDRIASYQAAKSYPDPENLQKLADALGVPVEELASTRPPRKPTKSAKSGSETARAALSRSETPTRRAPSESSNPGELVLTAVPAKPGRTILRVNREMSWKLAAQIHSLIRQAEDAEIRGALNEDPVLNPEINPDFGRVVGGTDTGHNNSNHA